MPVGFLKSAMFVDRHLFFLLKNPAWQNTQLRAARASYMYHVSKCATNSTPGSAKTFSKNRFHDLHFAR